MTDPLCEMGELERARAHAMAATEIRRGIGDPFGIAHALGGVALVEEKAGRLAEAAEALTEVVATYERLGIEGESAGTLVGLANLHRRLGDFGGAAQMLATALSRVNVSGDQGVHASATAALGLLAADKGRPEEALELLSRAIAEFEAGGYAVWERPAVETALAESRARIAATAAPSRVADSDGS